MRNLQITNLHYLAHITFQSLELIALELGIIAKAPVQPQRPTDGGSSDDRRRDADIRTDFSERLDSGRNGRSIGTGGPILSPDGKPLQPFTILGKREEFTQGVFRPGHSLPTMTVEEYLEEERRRGGMIEGGGAASMKQPVINEDDLELADRATMKARDWDEFKESNPR